MLFMAGPAASWSLRPLGLHGVPQALCAVLLTVLVMKTLVLGKWLRSSGSTFFFSFLLFFRDSVFSV